MTAGTGLKIGTAGAGDDHHTEAGRQHPGESARVRFRESKGTVGTISNLVRNQPGAKTRKHAHGRSRETGQANPNGGE